MAAASVSVIWTGLPAWKPRKVTPTLSGISNAERLAASTLGPRVRVPPTAAPPLSTRLSVKFGPARLAIRVVTLPWVRSRLLSVVVGPWVPIVTVPLIVIAESPGSAL